MELLIYPIGYAVSTGTIFAFQHRHAFWKSNDRIEDHDIDHVMPWVFSVMWPVYLPCMILIWLWAEVSWANDPTNRRRPLKAQSLETKE